MNLPYLTADLPGSGGQLKVEPEDFYVEEIPLYPPAGEGQHLYVEIEKRGLSTYVAINKIARALKISSRAIGYAGLKDARAITRQMISIDNVAPEAVEALDLPHIKILNLKRHHHKLRIGHLAGNRFAIRVRQVTEEVVPLAQTILSRLQTTGVPNFFDEQRFGYRSNTHRLGEMMVRKDAAGFVSEYLGKPQPQEPEPVQTARRLVDEERWADALDRWPRHQPDERRVLEAIIKANGQLDVAIRALSKKNLKQLFISAFQSDLFNQLLVQRLDSLDQLERGDVAYIHDVGAAFIVEDAAIEQPRADRFEISPSGPLFGVKTLPAQGEPGRRESTILAEQGLSLEDFDVPGLKIRGSRRPYRFKLKDAKLWWDDGLVVSFELQPGTYGTRVMAEIMKVQ